MVNLWRCCWWTIRQFDWFLYIQKNNGTSTNQGSRSREYAIKRQTLSTLLPSVRSCTVCGSYTMRSAYLSQRDWIEWSILEWCTWWGRPGRDQCFANSRPGGSVSRTNEQTMDTQTNSSPRYICYLLLPLNSTFPFFFICLDLVAV